MRRQRLNTYPSFTEWLNSHGGALCPSYTTDPARYKRAYGIFVSDFLASQSSLVNRKGGTLTWRLS